MSTSESARPPAIRIGPRDVEVLTELGTVGLLDTLMVKARHWPNASTRACQGRLRLYAAHGLIQVINLHEVSYGVDQGGRPPHLYALTPKGAEVVERATGSHPERVLYKRLKAATILHRRDLSRVRLAWDDGCKLLGLAASRWVMDYDTRVETDDEKRSARVPRRLLYDRFAIHGRHVVCCPDAASLTEIPNPNQPATTTELVALWEYDRGSESLLQVRGKRPGLVEVISRQAYRRYLPIRGKPIVRILWVCIDARRKATLAAAFRDDPDARDFRFASLEDLAPRSVLTAKIWTDTSGRERSVIASPPPTSS